MKVLVTGSAGTVGRPVCQELARRGHAVRGFDRASVRPSWRTRCVADIADEAAVRAAVRGMEAVVHLAAQPVDAPFSRAGGAERRRPLQRHERGAGGGGAADRPGELDDGGVARARSRARSRAPTRPARATTTRSPSSGPSRWARCTRAASTMSVLAVRLGWVVRNPDEARHMRELAIPDVLSVARADAGRFFARGRSRPRGSSSRSSTPPAAAASGCSTWSRRAGCSGTSRRIAGPKDLPFPLPDG